MSKAPLKACRSSGLSLSAILNKGNKRLVHTRIFAQNFFHSTIIPPWMSRDVKKFNELEFGGLVHLFQPKCNKLQKTYKYKQKSIKNYIVGWK